MPRGMGGPHGKNMAGEKAKDFKGTIKKLIRYMSAFKVHMFFVAVFAWKSFYLTHQVYLWYTIQSN